MKIDGKAIAEKIYADLQERIVELRKNDIIPTLAVLLIGDDPRSISYVSQKEKHAKNTGVKLIIERLQNTISDEKIAELVTSYNTDPHVHGIIIQRPAPEQITKDFLNNVVIPEKDVDGFHPNSDFAAPVALAVERILYEIFKLTLSNYPVVSSVTPVLFDTFIEWLLSKDIVVMGKGLTAGTPIISHFHDRNTQITVIDSQTENPAEILNEADIIISAVGKKNVLPPGTILREKIVIGVGLHTEGEKLRGDFTEDEVENVASFYTPTPGGVGPVNVAMLLSNVVRAAEEQTGNV